MTFARAAALTVLSLLLAAGIWRVVRSGALAAMVRADPESVLADPKLAGIALPLGRVTFARQCAPCHGPTGEADPARGMPSLRDGDHLYGEGRVAEIESIVRHGIRAGDRKGWNLAAMPAYASVRPYAVAPIPPLTPRGADDVSQFLLSLTHRATDAGAVERGRRLYAGAGGCWDCHGPDARGDPAVGAPDLADGIWLYGDGSPEAVARSIADGRAGICPAFGKTLDPAAIRAVAVYTASLARDAGTARSR